MEGGVFGVLDVAVTLGFAFQGVASKLCFRDKSLAEWTGVCCKFGCSSHDTILSLFVAGAVLCTGCAVRKCNFRGMHRES